MGEKRRTERLSSTVGAVGIKCPFFLCHSGRQIRCEAVIDDCTSAFIFRQGRDKAFHLHNYCETHYDMCEHYRMMMREKYREDE
ncbi:MAG: hypothetical protein ACI4WX_10165 [Aristaeellaceae bacterium]